MINDINMDTFCPLPFTQFDHRSKSFCCFNKLRYGNSYTDLMNHPKSIQLREDLINGIKNPLCNKCWDTENNGGESMRDSHNMNMTKDAALDIVNNKKMRNLVVDSGKACNLACRTCSAWNSSAHFKEGIARKEERGESLELYKSVQPNYESLLLEDLSHIEWIEILGGEPFLNLEHMEIIDRITADEESSRKVVIHYCTNGITKIPDRLVEIFNKFYKVNLTLSIDGLFNQFEYIRTLGKWDVLIDNIGQIKALLSIHPNLKVSINTTVSALNIMDIPSLISWSRNNSLQYSQVYVVNTPHYSFDIFNENQTNRLISLLTENKDENNSVFIDELIVILRKSSFNQESLDRFWWEADFVKRFRGMDIQEYLPDLVKLLQS